MAIEPIKIDGLREFARAVRKVDPEVAKELKAGFRRAASLIVADAKPKVPVGPAAGGHASRSIRSTSTAGRISVSEGGAKFPYMPWLDFGGKVGPNRSVERQFRKQGRYVWSSFAQLHDQVIEIAQESIADAAHKAGLEIS